jgi:hypothetical protein
MARRLLKPLIRAASKLGTSTIFNLLFNRHSPDSRPFEHDVPSHRGAPQRNSIATASVRSQTAGVPVRESKTRRFP